MRNAFDRSVFRLAALAAALCLPAAAQQNDPPSKKVSIEEPILRFDEVSVPSSGRVEALTGRVERWTRTGWEDVAIGEVVADGGRIQVPPNATVTIRFESGPLLQFGPMPTVRRVAFRVAVSG